MKKANKFICFLFALFFILSIFPFSAFAATENPMHTTYVCDDLRNMGYDLLDYPTDSSADFVTIIDFTEYGYHYQGDQRYYGLYIYLYNPSGKPLQSSGNSVEMSYIDKSNKATDFVKYPLEILSVSADATNKNVFYKMYIPASRNIANYIRGGIREYTVSSIELQYSSEVGTKPKSSVIGYTYKFQGFQKNFGPGEKDTLYRIFKEEEVIETKLNAASWFSKTSDLGEDYRYEISSVYFNIPKYFIEKYGNVDDDTSGLYSVQGEYYKYVTDGLLVSDQDVYNAFEPCIGKHISEYSQYENCTVGGTGFFIRDWSTSVGGTYSSTYKLSFNMYCGTFTKGTTVYSINSLDVNNHICNLVMSDSSDVAYASQTSFLNAYNKFGRNRYGDTGGLYSENSDIFTGLGHQAYSISVDDGSLNSSIKSFASAKKDGLGKWLHKLFNKELYVDEAEDYYLDCKPIVEIEKDDFNNVVDGKDITVSDKLFITTDDVELLENFYDEYSKDNHIYLMRFEVNPYYCPEVVITKDTTTGETEDATGYYFEKAIFEDFDVFSFTFRDEGGNFHTVPVSADPIDIVGSIVPGNNTIQPNPNDPTNNQSGSGKILGIEISVWLILLVIAVIIFVIWLFWKIFGKMISALLDGGGKLSKRRQERREFEVENYDTIQKMKADRKKEKEKKKQERQQRNEERKAKKEKKSE